MAVLLLGVCATCGSLLLDAHQQARRDAGRSVDNVAAALGFDLFRNVELLDLSIQAVVEGLEQRRGQGPEALAPA